VGLLRQVHAEDRSQWNVYLHPNRADLALVLKGPCSAASGQGVWQNMPLEEAIRELFAHVVRAIAALPPPLPPHVGGIAQAAAKTFDEQPGKVASSARRTLACHLGNLRVWLAAPEEAPAVGGPTTGARPELFGLERLETIEPEVVLYDLLLWAGGQASGQAGTALAAGQAMKQLARRMVLRHPRNMTAVLLTEDRLLGRRRRGAWPGEPLDANALAARRPGSLATSGQRALVHRPQGWTDEDAAVVAHALARRVAGLLAHIIRARPGLRPEEAAPLAPIADLLEAQLALPPLEPQQQRAVVGRDGALFGEEWCLELLGWFSRQAEDFCAHVPAFAGLRAILGA
jgi:hypothetical protein